MRLSTLFDASRTLWPSEKADYAAHLKRLEPDARRMRFHGPTSDEAIEKHVARVFANDNSLVIGWFAGGEVRAAAEVAVYETPNGTEAEAAFAVESSWRNRGVGRGLMHRAALYARNRGARRLHIATDANNGPMLRLAYNSGADFEIHDGDADGVLVEDPRSVFSICLETLEEEVGLIAWGWEVLMRRLQGGPTVKASQAAK
ncbi:MAG: GNAT family N-acetyltransferase [Neomegalonema sp.]|nr:GNAT family N-acetyltransferase [Neomegalonema sp.]